MKFYITGTRRGLGKALKDYYGTTETLEECDVFINCKHNGFDQVELLYKAADLKKQIINIGSHGSYYTHMYRYGVEKKALREANHHLFDKGVKTSIINFGYIDTESQEHKDVPKMSVDYCCGVIQLILNQPYNVKELTVCPSLKK